MRFLIKADTPDVRLLVEAQEYRQVWEKHSRQLRGAFREVTGLDFRQSTITARVIDGLQSSAGRPFHPMRLAGDYRDAEYKLATIVHELSHRLLGSNGLGVIVLGLSVGDNYSNPVCEVDHRHVYLFEYDVMRRALGAEGADICTRYETQRVVANPDDPHLLAWHWAMDLRYDQRQKVLAWLTQKKLSPDDPLPETIKPVDIAHWQKKLSAIAQGKQ